MTAADRLDVIRAIVAAARRARAGRAARGADRLCAWCGNPIPLDRRGRYCSSPCYNRNRRAAPLTIKATLTREESRRLDRFIEGA